VLEEAIHRHQPIDRRLHADCASSHDDKDPRLRVDGLGVGSFHELDLGPHVAFQDCVIPTSKYKYALRGLAGWRGNPNAV
jgi:hypothetical protein